MCYTDMIKWQCGYWKWGKVREPCDKQYRKGETCGTNEVYEIYHRNEVCELCQDIEKKELRLDKMGQDVEKWRQEGTHQATIERTASEMLQVLAQIYDKQHTHSNRVCEADIAVDATKRTWTDHSTFLKAVHLVRLVEAWQRR
jgi:hypothetical protein